MLSLDAGGWVTRPRSTGASSGCEECGAVAPLGAPVRRPRLSARTASALPFPTGPLARVGACVRAESTYVLRSTEVGPDRGLEWTHHRPAEARVLRRTC
jgi:hypothetical protein